MRYIIHAIDNASHYAYNTKNKKYNIKTIKEEDQKYNILSSDSFYLIDEKKPIDAVTYLLSIIKIDKNGEKIPLSQCIIESQKTIDNVEIGSENPDYKLKSSNIEIKQNTYASTISASCQFEIVSKEKTYELHEIRFYVVPENKIIEIFKM